MFYSLCPHPPSPQAPPQPVACTHLQCELFPIISIVNLNEVEAYDASLIPDRVGPLPTDPHHVLQFVPTPSKPPSTTAAGRLHPLAMRTSPTTVLWWQNSVPHPGPCRHRLSPHINRTTIGNSGRAGERAGGEAGGQGRDAGRQAGRGGRHAGRGGRRQAGRPNRAPHRAPQALCGAAP